MNSPFIDHINSCKKNMRKLRKKIYKHNLTHNNKKITSKTQDLTSILLGIFEKRKLPEIIISSLRNKRNIDIFSLKSLVLGNQNELKWDSKTLNTKALNQEKEVQQIYKHHCQRMQELKKLQTTRFSRRFSNSPYISSTEEDFSLRSDQSQSEKNSCSQFKDNDLFDQERNYESSNEQNIFSEVLIENKRNGYKIEVEAFSSFQMGESSILSGQKIFNF